MWNDVPIWVDSHLTLATWNQESQSFGLEERKKFLSVKLIALIIDSHSLRSLQT